MRIINANIFTPENKFERGEVIIEKDTIQSVQLTNEVVQPGQADTIDISNKYLVLVLWNCSSMVALEWISPPHHAPFGMCTKDDTLRRHFLFTNHYHLTA
jgi:hypothetical protein